MATQGIVSDYTFMQVQWQIYLTQAKEAYVFVWNGEEGHLIRVHEDKNLQKEMIAAAEDFHNKLVTGIKPDPEPADYIELQSEESVALAKEYAEVSDKISELEKKLKMIKESLIECGDDGNFIAGNIKATKAERKGSIDMKKLQADLDIDLEPYRKPSTYYYTFRKLKS